MRAIRTLRVNAEAGTNYDALEPHDKSRVQDAIAALIEAGIVEAEEHDGAGAQDFFDTQTQLPLGSGEDERSNAA